MKLTALPLLIALSSEVHAHEIKAGHLVIVHPMVDAAEKGQVTARGSVEVRNEGRAPDQLLSIRAEFADRATIAAPVPVLVPANGQAVSVAITFENIKQSLVEDGAYPGEMVFANTGAVQVDLMVHSHAH